MIFVGVKDEQIFVRDTKTKNYEYVVIAKQPAYINLPGNETPEEWQAINWCGSLDLARMKSKAAGRNYFQVEILPVFEKSANSIKIMKEDLDRQKKAREEALAAYQAEQAARIEEEALEDLKRVTDEEEALQAAEDVHIDLKEFQKDIRDALQKGEVFKFNGGGVNLSVQMEQPEKLAPVPYAPSKICKRCGKLLTGKESIEKGYGDKCWRKVWKFVRGTQEPEGPQSEKQTGPASVTDPDAAFRTRLEIKRRIDCSEETCLCGEKAEGAPVFFYDHEGGYMLPGYAVPQWIYTECPKCGWQFSLRKMASVDIEDIETEGRREAGIRLAEEEAAKAAKQAADYQADRAAAQERVKDFRKRLDAAGAARAAQDPN